MAKLKENPSGFNRKKYMELKKSDLQTMQDYVNTIYMRGYSRGHAEGYKTGREDQKESDDVCRTIAYVDAVEEIGNIPRIGKKLEDIKKILKEAFNIGTDQRDTAEGR